MRKLLLLCVASVTLGAQVPILWRDPGTVERLDLAGGVGGRSSAPRSPYRFIENDSSGSTAKVIVRDAGGRLWTVKFGEEVKAETFASRLPWAAGYFVEPVYYVAAGRMNGVKKPGRADRYIDKYGRFRDARFEMRNSSGNFLQTIDWTWKKNPFAGTRELNGLKTLLMLTSNWDNKDGRDRTSNTGILQRGTGPGRQWIYLVTDWGGTMGKWGNIFTRGKWDCEGFREQSSEFVKAVDDGVVRFGFRGQHDGDFTDDVRVSDIRWLMRYLGRLTDSQLRAGLRASGANRHEQACFARALRYRIQQLQQVANVTYRAGTR